jgi:hypothetical protein
MHRELSPENLKVIDVQRAHTSRCHPIHQSLDGSTSDKHCSILVAQETLVWVVLHCELDNVVHQPSHWIVCCKHKMRDNQTAKDEHNNWASQRKKNEQPLTMEGWRCQGKQVQHLDAPIVLFEHRPVDSWSFFVPHRRVTNTAPPCCGTPGVAMTQEKHRLYGRLRLSYKGPGLKVRK